MNRGETMDRSQAGRAARTYWHEVLTAGGRTVIPRWSAGPEKGVGVHEAALPEGLLTAVDGAATFVSASLFALTID